MNYNNVFPISLEGASSLYPILTALFGALLYAALFQFGYNRIIEKLYAQTMGWKIIYRIQVYLLLINFPLIMLTLLGLVYNNSLLPFEVALKIDQAYILIVCGYICYVEQSRQTPIRGFVVIKDSIGIILSLSLLISIYLKGVVNYQEFFTIAPVYLVSLFIQSYTNEIQSWLLLVLKIKEKNIYRSSFLLTEQSHPSNFLEIKDIISNHKDEIQQQIDDFISIAHKLNKQNEELTVLTNFARLFIPIKKAYQINQQIKSKEIQEHFVQSWEKVEYDYLVEKQRQQDDTDKVYSFNNSASTLMIKKTFTTDSLLDNDQYEKEVDQSFAYQLMKYTCYPLYLSKEITGRVRYFMDYLIAILIIATMFLMSNSIAYFSLFLPQWQNLTSLIYAGLLFYPVAKYFVKISQGANDYDFLGIFMEGIVLKTLVCSIGICLLNLVGNTNLIESGDSNMASLIIRIATVISYCGYLGWKRFAMRRDNFKLFILIFIVSHFIRVFIETLIDYI